MPSSLQHPKNGVRFVLERPLAGGPPWEYRGAVFSPSERWELCAVVQADGDVAVEGADEALAEKARLLLRALYKQSRKDGSAPPRKIVRWRGDK
jgi:hypothetical protein